MSEIIKRTKRGFTLLEMLMVVAIVGILASVCAVTLHDSMENGKIQQALATSRILESAKDSYKMAHPFASGAITEADLQNFLPQGYTVEIATPWNNVTYKNVLNLDAPVSFTRNGKTYYSNKGTN